MKLICSLFITFLKIGAFTFGGGYAMIALLENEFVEKKKWLEKYLLKYFPKNEMSGKLSE